MSNIISNMSGVAADGETTIDLCTKPVARIWYGRESDGNKMGVIGLPGFAAKLRNLEGCIRSDDPYADFHYHQIEQAIDNLEHYLNSQMADLESLLDQKVPKRMKVAETTSKNPTTVAVNLASKMAYKMLFQLMKLDDVVLKLLSLNHFGILPTEDKFRLLDAYERETRAIFYKIFEYKYTGVTRDDMAANNQRAQIARQKMGDLPKEYLEGVKRANLAPPLPKRRLQSLGEQFDKVKNDKEVKVTKKKTGRKSKAEASENLDEALDKIFNDPVEGQG